MTQVPSLSPAQARANDSDDPNLKRLEARSALEPGQYWRLKTSITVKNPHSSFYSDETLHAQARFGQSAICKTGHALAFPRFGQKYKHKLRSMKPLEVIQITGLVRVRFVHCSNLITPIFFR